MVPAQVTFAKCFDSALEYGFKKFKKRADPDLLKNLILTINAVRNSAPRGQQYHFPHALRDALNTLKLWGEMRERYKSMAGHFFSMLKKENLKKAPKEQIALTGVIEENTVGQLGWKL